MQKDELYKNSRKEALYAELCKLLEGEGSDKMHVIYMASGESKKQAQERYLKQTGALIRDGDIVLLVIYVDYLQPDG